jgi:hypothetical protein
VTTGWESPDQLDADFADTMRRFRARVAVERVRVGGPEPGVEVVIGADGFLVSVGIAPGVRRRRTAAEVAGIVADAVRGAEDAAAERRQEIGAALEET